MIVTYADIDGFKNLKGISFAPDPKYNIIVGPNAQGKTNLLEAMWILSGCKSFRGSKEKDYICLGGNRMEAKIKILDSVREQKISFEMTRSGSNPKNITLNGVKQKGTRALFDVFKCIAFIPDDVDIVKGSPEKRRNFVDMAASQLNPVFVMHINKNNAIMNQRNALLKGIMQGNTDRSILEIWDRQASREGAVISYMRSEYIRKFNEICGRLYRTISGGAEELELEYKSNVFRPEDLETPCGEQAYEQYYRKLAETADYDIRTGSTHAGVNRDEIIIKINGVSAKDYGSQGQIKSAALVMKLAQAEIFMQKSKDAPVIFLDDVMGELDESRQRFVFDIIKDMQVFITTPNESALLPEIKGKILRISGGSAVEEEENVSAHRE
ncbi:DNA replication/repair protein RecF [Ruminococcus flavefaciens]|uniref:DNA replication/repair protein RecF n=1 Tax=Ruminococcus flavefaciens TaxID=1265 RepID=UPI0026EDADAE|nr:DNA replication and repair protein RecF [Ruminococcus flavefaciens]MDD7516174.1 DNA replication and repair protein RecF [Ruminococcus flavefaciens]MDY5692046.1 DNA replication and repair protein RecF [Ruminococcus flavefaciens]